jgi:hypothetical protein
MTRSSVREYVGAIRERYVSAGRRAKGTILDEATRVTGYHRKALIRLLRPEDGRGPARRRGRPPRYGPVVADALSRMGGHRPTLLQTVAALYLRAGPYPQAPWRDVLYRRGGGSAAPDERHDDGPVAQALSPDQRPPSLQHHQAR